MKTAVLLMIHALVLTGCTEKGTSTMSFEAQSQDRIQSTIVDYLQRTVAALPPGTVIDSRRFAGAGHNSPCGDPTSAPAETMRFHTIGDLRTPGDAGEAVASAGAVWRDWGLRVVEREGFGTPNRFGYAPDGYRLQVITTAPGRPPTIEASSPCFPRELARDDVPFPETITAG